MSKGRDESAVVDGKTASRLAATLFVPSYCTPLLTADMLYTAFESGKYNRCKFVLLLDRSDKFLTAYTDIVKELNKKNDPDDSDDLDDLSCSVGYFIFDGTPYAGKVNRLSAMVNSRSVCVVTSKSLPWHSAGLANCIDTELDKFPQPMRVLVDEYMRCPIVTLPLVERLGYLFHPLCFGKRDAEVWLRNVADRLGVLQVADGLMTVESKADGEEVIGWVHEDDVQWSINSLNEILDLEVERLSEYIVS